MSAMEFLPMHSAAVMASPIRWLHLPKAGQSFIFTVLLYGCRNNATLVDVVHSFLDGIANTPRKLQYAVRQFHLMQSPDRCPLLNPPVGSRMVVGHAHLGRTDNNVVGLFRQPRQRMLSYCAGGDDFPSCVRASAQSHLGVAVHQIGGDNAAAGFAEFGPGVGSQVFAKRGDGNFWFAIDSHRDGRWGRFNFVLLGRFRLFGRFGRAADGQSEHCQRGSET